MVKEAEREHSLQEKVEQILSEIRAGRVEEEPLLVLIKESGQKQVLSPDPRLTSDSGEMISFIGELTEDFSGVFDDPSALNEVDRIILFNGTTAHQWQFPIRRSRGGDEHIKIIRREFKVLKDFTRLYVTMWSVGRLVLDKRFIKNRAEVAFDEARELLSLKIAAF